MITFLEYSQNLDQVVDHIHKMRASGKEVKDRTFAQSTAKNHINVLLGYVPAGMIDKLPDTARAELAIVILHIFEYHLDAWDQLGKHVEQLWDQPVPFPGGMLGRELLNRMSARVMQNLGAEFFISYSGNISKAIAFKYTHKVPRVYPSKSNYRWGSYQKVFNTLAGDYTAHFNNSRESVKK
jgi:hypothetical protein